jgi:hypothetical protein
MFYRAEVNLPARGDSMLDVREGQCDFTMFTKADRKRAQFPLPMGT